MENEALPEQTSVSSPIEHNESESDVITSHEPDASIMAEDITPSVPSTSATPNASSEDIPERRQTQRPTEAINRYEYIKLRDLKMAATEVNVYGVIKCVTKKQHDVHLELVDETLPADQKIYLRVIKGSAASLPNIKERHIIRAHQLKVVECQKQWSVHVSDARGIIMFPPENNGKEDAETVRKTLPFDGADLERVMQLRQWIKEKYSKRPLPPSPASPEGSVPGEEQHIDRGCNCSVKTFAEIQCEGHYTLYCKVVESYHKEGKTVLHVIDGTVPSELITREKACSVDNRDRNAEVSRTVKVILKSETGMKFQGEFVEMIGVEAETIVDAYSDKTCLAFVLWKVQNINIIPATHTQAELINGRLKQMEKDANRPPSAQITDIVKREPNDQEIENENTSSGHEVSGLEGNMQKRRRIAQSTEVQYSPDENDMEVSIRCIKSRGLEENCYLVEGVITQIEPPIKAGREKDIVCGYCSTCNTFSRYLSLIFNFEAQEYTCPQCPEDRRKAVLLVFSVSFHVVDHTSEKLVVGLCGESAIEFFGVTVKMYLRDPQIRKRVVDALLGLLPANEVQRKIRLCIRSAVHVSGMRYMINRTYLTYNERE